jgi:hypothetical protein
MMTTVEHIFESNRLRFYELAHKPTLKCILFLVYDYMLLLTLLLLYISYDGHFSWDFLEENLKDIENYYLK